MDESNAFDIRINNCNNSFDSDIFKMANKQLIKALATKETVNYYSEKLMKLYGTKWFNLYMDIIRIALLAVAVIILIVLIGNINEVKLLASDVCKICMEKSGCDCFCLNS